MNRRSVMTLAAVAAVPAVLASGPLFAQSSDANANADPNAANANSAGAGAMGEAEMKHLQDTMRVGGLSLLSSRVAQEKGNDNLVKAFAKWETAEQEATGDVLKGIQQMGQGGQAQMSGQVQPPSDEEIMAMLGDQEKQSLEQMQGMSGSEFDAAYIKSQLEGHQQLLQIQEDYLASGQNPHHVHVAKLARPAIQEHIEHLQGMSQATSSTQQQQGGEQQPQQ